MARRTIAPQIADISQDIAGEIPLPLILHWATGSHTARRHQDILAPHMVTGTTVSSDSAGLSKISQQKTLLEVMKLVHDPKVIVAAYGQAIGGQPIGVWAADNTQMFYQDSIPTSAVIDQMLAAQHEIAALPVRLGLGIHYGKFISLGGGLFGPDADLVEELAETHTQGGDITLTSQTHSRLPPGHQQLAAKTFVKDLNTHVFTLTPSATRPKTSRSGAKAQKTPSATYPFPFSQDFFDLLNRMGQTATKADYDFCNRFSQTKTILLLKINHPHHPFLLDHFTHWILANSIVQKEIKDHHLETIKSNGSLGIFLSDDPSQALACALSLKDKLTTADYQASLGLSQGEVFVFPLTEGGKDIAGNPVNVASKLAEDVGTDSSIWIDSSVKLKKKPEKAKPFQVPVSGITLSGLKLA